MIARTWMNVCAVASFLIVGRFLGPAEFGVYALASAAILLPMTVIGAGFSDHVIGRDPERQDEATAFWSTAALGLAFALAAALGGLALGAFGLGDIGRILLLLAPLPALWGLSAILEAMLIRDDRAGQMAICTVIAEALGLGALIAAVLAGWGVLSLVAARLVNNTVLLIAYWALIRPPRWARFDKERFRALWKFSIAVVGARVMTWADGYGVEFLLAAIVPRSGVGLFRMAGRLNAAAGSILVFAPWQAQLAYMGERVRKAPGRVGAAVLRALQMHLSLVAPLFAGLAMCAHDLIGLLLGPDWAGAADVLAIVAIGSLTQVVWGVLIAVLVATGRSRRMFAYQCGVVAGASLGLAIGAYWGIAGAALGKVLIGALLHVGGLLLIVELGRRDFLRILNFLARIALACGALAAAMMLARAIAPQGVEMWVVLARLVLMALAGLAAYLAALRLLAPDAARQLLFSARRKLRRARPPASMAHAELQV